MRIVILFTAFLLNGCVMQLSLMKDCDKAHTKQYDLQYKEYCEFNQRNL